MTVPIATLDDRVDEPNESVTLTIVAIVSADARIAIDPARASSSLAIVDNDTAGILVRALGSDRPIVEGQQTSFEVLLLSRPESQVTFAFTGADPGVVLLAEQSLLFSPNDWDVPRVVTVTVVDDAVVDGDKRVEISAAASSDDPIYDALPPSTIALVAADNDTATLRLTPTTRAVTEGSGGVSSTVRFDLTLDVAVEGGLSVTYDAIGGTADQNDFRVGGGVLRFTGAAGETQSVAVEVFGDDVVEADESFRFSLGPVGTNTPGLAARIALDGVPVTVTVEDDDTAQVTIEAASVREGSTGGTTGLGFVVRLSRPVQGGFSLSPLVVGVTATPGVDFQAPSGGVAFRGVGGEAVTLTVPVTRDQVIERDESLRVTLATITGLQVGIDPAAVTISVPSAEGVIVDDDTAAIRFVASGSSVDESGAQHAVEVRLEAPPGVTLGEAVAVRVVDTRGGTASAADYRFATQTVEFPAGSVGGTVRTVTLETIDDGQLEATETVQLRLEPAGDGLDGAVSLSAPSDHVVTIVDDPRNASISGVLWVDSNGDGVRQVREAPIPGLAVLLTGADSQGGAVRLETTSGPDGSYRFGGLTAGVYEVAWAPPRGFIDGADAAGTVDGRSVGSAGGNRVRGIELTPGGAGVGFSFAVRGVAATDLHAGRLTASRLASTTLPATVGATAAPVDPALLLIATPGPANATLRTPSAIAAQSREPAAENPTAADAAFAQFGRRWRF